MKRPMDASSSGQISVYGARDTPSWLHSPRLNLIAGGRVNLTPLVPRRTAPPQADTERAPFEPPAPLHGTVITQFAI